MDARIVELASTTKLPAEEVVVAVHAELSKRFDAIENELFALIDGLQVQRATTLRDNLALAVGRLPTSWRGRTKKDS